MDSLTNSPQKCKYGMIAEQLSGTAFTAPRAENQRSWLYRKRPSVLHSPFHYVASVNSICSDYSQRTPSNPNQLRWKPFDIPDEQERTVNFVEGLSTLCGAGDPRIRNGCAIHVYTANADMKDSAMYNSDGDLLLVPQQGILDITTEFGRLRVCPSEIAVIQQGIKFKVDRGSSEDDPLLLANGIRGYVMEVWGGHFRLPDLGPIGANGLANPRGFKTPIAWYEKEEINLYKLYNKYQNQMFLATMFYTPFDVVAWHGNYAPYKYNLKEFNTMNTVSYDHADPSIFTVLTCPSNTYGTALVDFVIFPPRWSVAENTFRPPYFHRNCMSEFMGIIYGKYEAKEEGFQPGGASLHSAMTPHGPDTDCYAMAVDASLLPQRVAENTMAFMFESSLSFSLTEWGEVTCAKLDEDYHKCWQGLQQRLKLEDVN